MIKKDTRSLLLLPIWQATKVEIRQTPPHSFKGREMGSVESM
ncbi:hypothetical protein [Fischerella thermalis]|nr:hypothetical protein [Fischerella thermalis]